MTRKKVSVLTWTYRPGYIDNLVDSLTAQTMAREDFEWILVDDLYSLRQGLVHEYVHDRLDYQHLQAKTGRYQNAAVAFNQAVRQASGELLYLMADYMYIHPSTLERHWCIYSHYGPDVIISGALMDGVNTQQLSACLNVAKMIRLEIGDQVVEFPESTPPVDHDMVDEIHAPTRENLISIWKTRFSPVWFKAPADWRSGCITKRPLEWSLFENYPGDDRWTGTDWLSWYWTGRNDSCSAHMINAVGGLEEGTPRAYGADSILARRMYQAFPKMRYLVDTSAPAYMLPHPFRKGERPEP